MSVNERFAIVYSTGNNCKNNRGSCLGCLGPDTLYFILNIKIRAVKLTC